MLRFEVLSDIGKKRTVNEDSAAVFTIQNGPTLAVIADGMGGHRGGDFASSTAVQLLGEKFQGVSNSTKMNEEDWKEWLLETVSFINHTIFEIAEKDENFKGMGTTLDAVLVDGNDCLITHVGDSRVYIINEAEIIQVTKDHSFVNILLDSGEITEEEAATHPQRNWIMRAVGSEKSITPDFYHHQLKENTYLLICTDGLSNKVSRETIHSIVTCVGDLHTKAVELVKIANDMGGEDNISVVLGYSDSEVSSS
ncbi:Stp1/IreP family PP2C-type Ser/Thr phosphatase [Sporosarcina highlanderae]|uniref:Stp1/IreP family PP2C-type Ser/Thr phosphatase n=1 Tax=Sporosarcina highlanderae TaxID=3035916 RepID=A0ABT8JSK4_9BACL|nr:Stp1/IreP family PP2C-type Ser/Thr phosphatase [Sporosarcina highlanderae]MDN4607516.1 Stp1/IreP family PP2C-type Ser/Thr phosphatase [Sporosarcina highlanderae]